MVACVAVLVAIAVSPAQAPSPAGERAPLIDRAEQKAVFELADPARVEVAAQSLVAMGEQVVPTLAHVILVPQRYVEPRTRVLGAIYVLGRLGAAATDALPALEQASRAREVDVAAQAAWALGEVGVHLAALERGRLAASLEGGFLAAISRQRLLLGLSPAPADLRSSLFADDPAAVVAACRLLQRPAGGRTPGASAARPNGTGRAQPIAAAASPSGQWSRRDWTEFVHDRLGAALVPAAMPWEVPQLAAAVGDLAGAWLAVGDGPPDLLVARGLLRHGDPAARRRGVAVIRQVRGLPRAVRAELLPLLFDPDAEVRQLAAWTYRGWREEGLLALPVLRRLAVDDPDVGVRMACAGAADDLIGAVEPTGLAALVLAVDARLRGERVDVLPLPVAAAEVTALAELLHGSEWTDAATVARLLGAPADDAPLPAELLRSGLRLCANVDPELRALAAGWVARHACGEVAAEQVQRGVFGAASVLGFVDPALVEVCAWVAAGPRAADAEVLRALRHESPRVFARAVVEVVGRGLALVDADVEALRARLGAPALVLLIDPDGGAGLGLRLDLDREVTMAATVALLARGVPEVEVSVLGRLAPRGADPDAWIAEQLAGRSFVALAERIERNVADVIGVPAGIAPR